MLIKNKFLAKSIFVNGEIRNLGLLRTFSAYTANIILHAFVYVPEQIK